MNALKTRMRFFEAILLCGRVCDGCARRPGLCPHIHLPPVLSMTGLDGLKPNRLSATGRIYPKETAMLTCACGLTANSLLPPALAYVDSFGPFYPELGLTLQPATTDRTQSPHTRYFGDDGWSLTSYWRRN